MFAVFEQRCALLVSKKANTEEIQPALEATVDSLTQANEGLMIQNESLERDVCDRDKLIAGVRVEVEVAQRDWDWLLRVGVVRIMDKLIEHLEFIGAVSRIMHVTFVAGEESGRNY